MNKNLNDTRFLRPERGLSPTQFTQYRSTEFGLKIKKIVNGFSVVWTLLTFNMRLSMYKQDIDFGWTIPLKKSQCFIYKWAGSNVSSVLCFMHVLMFACSSIGSWEPFIFFSVWVKWAQLYIWMNLQRSSSTPSYLPAFVFAITHTLKKWITSLRVYHHFSVASRLRLS